MSYVTKYMGVSKEVIEHLVDNDIHVIFGIPGTQSLPLNEEIDSRADIRFVMARHETAVSHQAWGYSETSNHMAATVVIPGPGDMNAMNGLKNALNDCTPILHIAVETDPHIRGGDGIHETPPDTYDNIVKENITVKNPESAIVDLERAISIAQTPPKGPVRIGIPKSFLGMDVSVASAGNFTQDHVTGIPDDSVSDAVDVLDSAERPVIIAGGGVRAADAGQELQAFAERLNAPVVPTYKGKGTFSETHELFAGILSVGSTTHLRTLIAESDVAVGIGTDFDAVTTQQWSVDVPDSLVHITMNADDIGTSYPPSVGIVADATDVLAAMVDQLEKKGSSSADETGADRAATVRRNDAELLEEPASVTTPPLTSASAESVLNSVLPDDAIVTADAGGFRIWALHVIEVASAGDFVDTGSWATMGTGLPSAIGAKLANPGRDVVALMGDGGLMMCLHELHTAAVEGISVVAIVLNNSDYATISAEAAENFDLSEGAYQWDEVPVRFDHLGEHLGVATHRAETRDEIRETVTDALDTDRPTLIEIPTDPREPQAKPLK